MLDYFYLQLNLVFEFVKNEMGREFVHACSGTFAYVIWPGDILLQVSIWKTNVHFHACDRVGEIEPLLSQPRRSILKFFRIMDSLWKV